MLHAAQRVRAIVPHMAQHTDSALDDLAEDVWSPPARVGGRDGHRRNLVALLLEDEPLISLDVEMTLSLAGFEVFNVRSCKEAAAWLDNRLPDVAIVDIKLQDGQCGDVVSRLLESGVPFIVHSGDHKSTYAETPFANGVWLGKPATSRALLEAAEAAVEGLVRSDQIQSA